MRTEIAEVAFNMLHSEAEKRRENEGEREIELIKGPELSRTASRIVTGLVKMFA